MNARLRWKLKAIQKGRIGGPRRGSMLHDGVKTYATVSANEYGTWYWVAGWDSNVPHMNTCDTPVKTVEEAKKQALAYVKKHII